MTLWQPKREKNGKVHVQHFSFISDRKLVPTLQDKKPGTKYPSLTKETFYVLLIVNSKMTIKRCCYLSRQKSDSSNDWLQNLHSSLLHSVFPLTPIVQINSLIVPKSLFIVWKIKWFECYSTLWRMEVGLIYNPPYEDGCSWVEATCEVI